MYDTPYPLPMNSIILRHFVFTSEDEQVTLIMYSTENTVEIQQGEKYKGEWATKILTWVNSDYADEIYQETLDTIKSRL